MIAEWLAGVSAMSTAAVAVVALLVQARSTREARTHEVALAHEQRVWAQRADLYARILEAVRQHIEEPDPIRVPTVDDPRLTRLVGEAEVFASERVRELIARFVYDDPEQKLDLWAELQIAARAELLGQDHKGYVEG